MVFLRVVWFAVWSFQRVQDGARVHRDHGTVSVASRGGYRGIGRVACHVRLMIEKWYKSQYYYYVDEISHRVVQKLKIIRRGNARERARRERPIPDPTQRKRPSISFPFECIKFCLNFVPLLPTFCCSRSSFFACATVLLLFKIPPCVNAAFWAVDDDECERVASKAR